MALFITSELAKLDEALALVARGPHSEMSALIHEHLQGARTYLLGAAKVEYRLNLHLAQRALAAIDDHPLRSQIDPLLTSLLESRD